METATTMLKHLLPLIEALPRKHLVAGTMILHRGETPTKAVILAKGLVKVYSISSQGDERVVMYHVAGEFFPSAWMFGKAPHTLFFYEAVTDVELACVSRDELIQFMLSKSESLHAMLDYFTTSYTAAFIRINALEQSKAREKLIYTLYFLCLRYGKGQNKRVTLPFDLTHQDIANLVGLTRETTAMEMSKLKKQKAVTYRNQNYSIDTERLMALVDEDSNFHDISIPG